MKKILLFLLVPLLFSCSRSIPSCKELEPVLDVIERVAPWTKGKVSVSLLAQNDDQKIVDAYEYSTPKKDHLHIKATSIPAAGMAFNHYLKNYCHRSFSMTGSNLSPLDELPQVSKKVKASTTCRYRHFFNFCTLNYSAAFWDWDDWEKMIDFMVLNGVNLTIATTGLEKVWYNTLKEFDYTDEEIFDFLPGPAFNAWHIMGNLEGWGGPITTNMMEKRSILGRLILDALRKYQIQPISSAFYGMVPTSLKSKYPEADIVPQGDWVGGFVRPDILSPLDSLYKKMSSVYYKEMKNLYGDISFFAGEPFHEGGVRDGIDVSELAYSVFNQMRENFPQARWFLQAWGDNPTSEFLSKLSREDDVLIWDFRGEQSAEWERRNGYEGFPFLWGVINNFGETTGLYGKLDRFVQEYFRAANAYSENMVGIGCSAEGVLNNPVNYDLLFELPWHSESFSVDEWLKTYVASRYGSLDEDMLAVWRILLETAYSSKADASKIDPISKELPQIVGTPESVICAIPSMNVRSASAWGTSYLYYSAEEFKKIIPHLVAASEKFADCDAFAYDLVNFSRQLLANEFHSLYDSYVSAVKSSNLRSMASLSAQMISILDKMETVLSTSKDFMLGTWLEKAQSFGDTKQEKRLCMWNAKAQVSYWGGERGDTSLRDYAHKEWAGLISSIYKPRWERFFQLMEEKVSGKNIDPTLLTDESATELSIKWSHGLDQYETTPTGSPVGVALPIIKSLL